MLDTLLDFVSDGGTSKASTTSIALALFFVIAAALFFSVLYVRYQKLRKQRNQLSDDNLIRRGQLDLKKKYLDVNGNVRESIFSTESLRQPVEENDDVKEETNDDKKEKTSVGDQIFETITSGKLINMFNRFHVRTKELGKNLEPKISPFDRLRAEKVARMADESVNPLFRMKTERPRSSDSDSDSESESDSDES